MSELFFFLNETKLDGVSMLQTLVWSMGSGFGGSEAKLLKHS